MGEQLGCHYSDKIDAIALGGAHRFDMPQKDNHIAWLFLHCTGDYLRISEQALLNQYIRENGGGVLHAIMPPFFSAKLSRHFHHSPGKYSWELRQCFLEGIVALRDKHNGVLPAYNEWEYHSEINGRTYYYPSKPFADAWSEYTQRDIQDLA